MSIKQHHNRLWCSTTQILKRTKNRLEQQKFQDETKRVCTPNSIRSNKSSKLW
jgi:hypothetical protein